jgi:hypothetical protein
VLSSFYWKLVVVFLMQKVVRFVAQYIDADSGDLIEESIIKEEALSKASTLKELGYTHIEQIVAL